MPLGYKFMYVKLFKKHEILLQYFNGLHSNGVRLGE